MKKVTTPLIYHFHTKEKNDKEMMIKCDSKIKDIQQMFSAHYPFLKIEFFQSGTGTKLLKAVAIDSNTFMPQMMNNKNECTVDINPDKTVSDLGHEFQSKLGLIIQVSRKSGSIWNVISITEGWTLESQNAAGEFISSEMQGASKK